MAEDRFEQDGFVRGVVLCGRVLLYGPLLLAALWILFLIAYQCAGGSLEQPTP